MSRWRIGIDPDWRQLNRLLRSVDDLFDTVIDTRKPWMAPLWSGAQLFPLLNVRSLDHSFIVTAELPGISSDDLEIKIEDDTLTIRGERRPRHLGDGERYHRRERSVGAFRRSLALPGRIDAEHVSAAYKDGVLTVTLRKKRA